MADSKRGAGDDRLPDDAVMPGKRHPVVVQTGRYPVIPHRAVIAGPHVVLAGADHLDRLFYLPGHLSRFDNEVGAGTGPPAEAAPQESGFQGDLLRLEPGHPRCGIAVHGLELAAGSDQTAVASSDPRSS